MEQKAFSYNLDEVDYYSTNNSSRLYINEQADQGRKYKESPV